MIISIMVAALLCALTTGLVFAFTVVVMPGIQTLDDQEFLRAFKVMDRVIQDNDWRFLTVWAGSVVASLVAFVTVLDIPGSMSFWLTLLAVAIWILGVQVPTVRINVPLNNQLQKTDLDSLDTAGLKDARSRFEGRWVFWNTFRTLAGLLATLLFMAAVVVY